MAKSYLITGGTGFLGSALVRRMVKAGHRVRVLDNELRGSASRLADMAGEFEFIEADIRDGEAVQAATKGMDCICHLAFVNGTEFFYSMPEVVLDVGVKGMVNILDACRRHDVSELILASSSEVYQTPPYVPTDENVPLSIPDPLNPRYSYAAGKIISEIMTLNYGRKFFERVVVFRPHNVYGPDMGWQHAIPQFVLRMKRLCAESEASAQPIQFPIQGTGEETRSFVYIDDFTDGLMLLIERGEHVNIYNIGTTEEHTMAEVVQRVASYFHRSVEILPGEPARGGTPRRCPDITKISKLGYEPGYTLERGLASTVKWYDEHAHVARTPQNTLER